MIVSRKNKKFHVLSASQSVEVDNRHCKSMVLFAENLRYPMFAMWDIVFHSCSHYSNRDRSCPHIKESTLCFSGTILRIDDIIIFTRGFGELFSSFQTVYSYKLTSEITATAAATTTIVTMYGEKN